MNIAPKAHILQHMGHVYQCGYVDDQYLSPYWTRANWISWWLRKSRSFIFKYGPLGPTSFNILGMLTIVNLWVINTYHKPNQSHVGDVAALVAEKKQALYISMWATGAHILQHIGHVDHWRSVGDQYLSHTKPEPRGCLGCWEKAGPLYLNVGHWGPHPSTYGACLPLQICGWSISITIPN